jgi:hypothetical protein
MAAATTSMFFAGKFVKDKMNAPAEKAKEAQKMSLHEANVAKEKSVKEQEEILYRAAEAKRQRASAIQSNRTSIVDPLGLSEKADTIRKSLTGA